MGVNPFVHFSYKGHPLNKYSEKICHETGGDCFKWINQHLKIEFNSVYANKERLYKEIAYKGTLCPEFNAKEIPNHMYVCGPLDKIKMNGNFHSLPHRSMALKLSPNYDIIKNKTKVDETIDKISV